MQVSGQTTLGKHRHKAILYGLSPAGILKRMWSHRFWLSHGDNLDTIRTIALEHLKDGLRKMAEEGKPLYDRTELESTVQELLNASLAEFAPKKKRIGIVFGCFIPLHAGHIDMIERALKENESIIIGVTGHDMDRGVDFIPFLRRVRLMNEIYGGNRNIVISEIDDRAIGLTGTFSEEAWQTWCQELFRRTDFKPEYTGYEYTWYTGEDRYIEKLKQIYPEHTFVKLDRQIIPISGTVIREHLGDTRTEYEQYIHPVFNDYLNMMSNIEFEEEG